jgi:hypothetical protein
MSLDEHDARASAIVAASNDNPETKQKKRPPLSTRLAPQYVPFAMDMLAAAHYCSVGTTVLYTAITEKKLKLRKLGGKSLLFRDDLEDWLRSEAVESMPVPKRARPAASPVSQPE